MYGADCNFDSCFILPPFFFLITFTKKVRDIIHSSAFTMEILLQVCLFQQVFAHELDSRGPG